MKRNKSESLFEQAQTLMPGGVNSPVRAFKNVDGKPVFFKSAKGPTLIDEDDNLSGIISVQDYRGWVLEEDLKEVIIMKDLASTQVNTVTPEESMLEVLKHWDKGDMLPVVSKTGSLKIVGILARRDALIAYNKALNDDTS